MVRCVYDECRSVSKLYLGIGKHNMVRYVANECCHVSSLHLLMGDVWSKVAHPRLVQRLGDGVINNVVGTNTLMVGWRVMFGEIICKVFLTRFPVDEEYYLGHSISNPIRTYVH